MFGNLQVLTEELVACPFAGKPSALPPGWHEKKDANDRVYYDNYETHQTRWTRPVTKDATHEKHDLERLANRPQTFKFWGTPGTKGK